MTMQYFMSHIQYYAFLILLFVTNADSPIRVLSQLNRFDKAPDLILPKLASPAEDIDLKKLDKPAILVFGEAYHQKTLESLVKLKEIVDNIGLTEADLQVFLILSHVPNQEQMAQLREKEKISVEILFDKKLKAFGDYGITVLPSIVVINKEHRIALALSGVPLSFADMVEDAILLATKRITQQQLESSQSLMQETSAQQETVKRVRLLTNLARQLARRNFTAIALKRYREVLELDNTYIEAMVGVARCLIKLNLLSDAIEELQKILQINAEHVEANLMMSQIEIIQGGDGIADGRHRIEQILTVNPDHPEANYLMGMVCEAQGEMEHALKYYKKAAKRLLEIGMN